METGKIILVIDDDRDFQTILRALLTRNGFEVRSIFDGDGLGELLQEPPPDIILLDADLPIRNGVEVGRQLKSHHSTRNVPVIMVSANPFVDDLSREAGAIDFVQKPFTLKTLIQKVEDHLAFSA
jgi:DNA-binding response OmpR family regulator